MMLARARLIVLVLAVAGLGAAPAREAPAQDDVFSVAEVAIDVTAQTAAAAREQAIAEAQLQGYARLIGRLVPEAEAGRAPRLGARELASLVRNFEIDRERASAVRYIATFRVNFDADQVRRLLRESRVPYAETPSKPVLVLPLIRHAGGLELWGDANPWRDAWRALPPQGGLVPLVLPLGDAADAGAVSAEDAARGEMVKLQPFARRHGADDVLIAIAEPTAGALDVAITRLSANAQERTWVRNFAAQRAGERPAALMTAAAAAIAREIEETWKRDNVIGFDAPREIVARVAFSAIEDWARLRRGLAGIALIERSEVVSVMRSGATVKLRVLGDEEQLKTALAQRDLVLGEREGGWFIRLGGEAPRAAPPAPAPAPSGGESEIDPERR